MARKLSFSDSVATFSNSFDRGTNARDDDDVNDDDGDEEEKEEWEGR